MPVTKKQVGVGAAAALAIAVPLVASFEGLVQHVYTDSVGVATYCYGETTNPQPGKEYTIEECNALLGNRMVEFDTAVSRCVAVPLPTKTRAAFDSLAYNIGIKAFCWSSVVAKANKEDLLGACDAMLAYNKGRVRGVLTVLPGLDKRRHKERDLCRAGVLGT